MEKLKKLFNWLAGIFKAEEIWYEKGQGQWVKRRRYHPALKAFVLVCALFFGVWAWRSFFPSVSSEPEVSDIIETPLEVSSSDVEAPQGDAADLADVLDKPVLPGPIPDGLQVEDGEYWVRIDKGDYKLYLYKGPDVEKTYEVAVGRNPGDKERVGDNKTPNGIFTVQSIENSSAWSHDFGDGKGIIQGAYGPWFIRLRTGWRGIGIHGTHDPDSLGSMVSEGCVRMHNSELEELKQFANVKMKVVIEE